ncbi:hypothetical protein ABH935_008581 [Catenulispora sp. GAS73]|uniref:ThiF family adenylyltransferase n=1 Tax=Catenulispora sp. GAS73 TaxID=3156269 RepID=UPI003515E337
MSSAPFARSDDLRRLLNEGYDVELIDAHLLVKQVPYVDAECRVKFGTLVSPVTFSGEQTAPNPNHQCWFIGDTPCDQHGKRLSAIIIDETDQQLAPEIRVNFGFSSKPHEGYADYYAKMVAYSRMLSGHAQALQPHADARVFPTVAGPEDSWPFVYRDSASSRGGIAALMDVFRGQKIAIVGLGGTGSYILDYVSKTPVDAIHLFDGDWMLNHNAFRAPGAASVEELNDRPLKVDYLAARYSKMHRGIVPHGYHITAANVDELADMDFVFLTADQGMDKAPVVARLEELDRPFIEVGMGVENVDGALTGLLRVTTSLPGRRSHVHENNRIPEAGDGRPDDYGSNIQIADLNSLNAILAVMRWKRHLGLYHDMKNECYTTFSFTTNRIVNADTP